jgi:ABC-2 type transport system ATP-binding protein
MLEITGVTKAYGRNEVLRGVDLHVPAGRITGLLGANGAGKSTLISIAAGLVRPDAGRVMLAGIDVRKDRRRAARQLGLAPQDLGVYPTLTVLENLVFAARIAGVRTGRTRARSREVAEQFGLVPQLDQRADQLSGGQKRRLHTAMALLHRPAVLFLDEPTVGADVPSRAGILAAVRAVAAEGTAVVYTTHYLTELESLDAHIAVLHGGHIVVDAPLETALSRYATTVTITRTGLESAYLAITGLATVEEDHALVA